MGYVHDTSMSQFIPPEKMQASAGTWTDSLDANVWSRQRAAADVNFTVKIPICIPQNSVPLKGACLKSIILWYRTGTDVLTASGVAIYKATLPATGTAFAAPASQAFSYDSGHDTAAKRGTVDEHKLTITLTDPIWLDNDDLVTVELVFDPTATAVFDFYGARAEFTLRV